MREQISDSRKLVGQNSAQPYPQVHPPLSQPRRRTKGHRAEKRLTGLAKAGDNVNGAASQKQHATSFHFTETCCI